MLAMSLTYYVNKFLWVYSPIEEKKQPKTILGKLVVNDQNLKELLFCLFLLCSVLFSLLF